MQSKVYKLRKAGAKLGLSLPDLEQDKGQFAHGSLYWGRPHGSPHEPNALHLCASGSTPGLGIIWSLYEPRVTGVTHNGFIYRGIEQADGAAVVQDWVVVI